MALNLLRRKFNCLKFSGLGPRCNASGYTTWTDGCLLGRQQQFETRNWTISCRTGRDYKRPKLVKNCPCGRDDFEW